MPTQSAPPSELALLSALASVRHWESYGLRRGKPASQPHNQKQTEDENKYKQVDDTEDEEEEDDDKPIARNEGT